MDPIIGAIIGAIVAGGFSLCGVIITSNSNNVKMQGKFELHQAVTDQKIDRLGQDVKDIAEYTKRVPLLEQEVDRIKSDLNNFRVDIERLENESHK